MLSAATTGRSIHEIDTPALLVRYHVLEANILRLQAAADAAGLQVRPHIKAHKTPQIAHMQMRAGAAGVTCAKIGEAEVMADAGIDDIFIANQIVGEIKLRRLVALGRRVPQLSTAVDGLDCARGLSEAFSQAGLSLDVLVEVDTGAGRCGVAPEGLVELASRVAEMPALSLAGIMAYAASAYRARGPQEQATAAAEEGGNLAALAAEVRAVGLPVPRVSGGSTPTGLHYRAGCGLTEIRSGTYCLYDRNQMDLGTTTEENVAATVLSQIISVPTADRAICDAGTKSLDQQVGQLTDGYGWTRGEPRIKVAKINDEHGYLQIGDLPSRPTPGTRVEIIPPRICTALNLYDLMYVIDDEDRVLDVWPIAARGKNA